MANVLSLRTGAAGASILKLDAAFFREKVIPLLQKRGLDAAVVVDVALANDDAERAFAALLGGKATSLSAGSLSTSSSSWRALSIAASARDAVARGGAKDVGGDAIAPKKKTADYVRQKSGKRVKARPKTQEAPTMPTAPPPPTTQASSSVTDPAAFAAQNLARLAALVCDAIKGAPEGAIVTVKDGALFVDGAARGPLAG